MLHIRRTVLIAALIAGSLAPLAAQEAASAPGAEEWYLGKPIADVVFTGLVNVKAEDAAAVVKPYLGQPFSYELFERLQNAVVALDWFERLEPVARDPDGAKSTVVVEFQVTERPAVSAIEVAGNSQVRTPDILEKVLLKPGDLVSATKLRADEEAIRLLYLDKGYPEVAVGSRTEPDAAAGSVKVVFTVTEGSQTKIRQVRFSGNIWASESTLRSKMDTKPPTLFDPGVFQASRLEADRQKIVEYYADHGFIDAGVERIEKTAEAVEDRTELVITVYVHEGDQYSYAGMSFEGNRVFPSSQLEALATQRTGRPVSRQKVLDDFQRIVDLYTENGYIFNQIERREVRDEAAKTVAYVVEIVEFEKAHIERIIFKGNEKTDEHVLRRELDFAEGDVFNRAKIVDGYRALYNLQYFSNVTLDTPTGSAPGLVDLVFTVEEQSTADINFGVTFSGDEDFPISGMVKWNERNLGGNGQTLGIEVEASPGTQLGSLSFFEPWLAGIRWSAGASFSVKHSIETDILQDLLAPVFSDDEEGISAPDPYATRAEYLAALAAGETIPDQYLMSYDMLEISLALTTGYRVRTAAGQLGVKGSVSSRVRKIGYDPLLYRPYEASVRDNLGEFRVIDRISPTIYLDGRDYYLNPSNGWYLSQGFSFTGGILGGSRHYIRTDTVAEGFLQLFSVPVLERWEWSMVLAAHTGLSMILLQFHYQPGDGWGWGVVTDSTDLLYIDGMTVGRGWRQLYGQALWDSKVELRTPIAKNILTGVLFFDAAALWNEAADLASVTIEDFRFSFGAGLRFTIPQFPIRLYLGKAFQVQDGKVVWKQGDIGTDPDWSLSFIISLGGDVF